MGGCCKMDRAGISQWLRGPSFAIYFNYALSAWGDWMWQFAAGLYLVHLAGGTLRLAAIFGFTGGTLMLLLGGIIGDWVDRNGRLKVVTITLFIQNVSVALCAISVCITIFYHPVIVATYWQPVSEATIITLAITAYISSMSYKIAIEKDWIVVVASGNTSQLTNLNAVTRAIDLSCKILAPTAVGFILAESHIIAAICIAGWNVISVVCEYALLRRVYKLVPQLAVKGSKIIPAALKADKKYKPEDIEKANEEEMRPMGHSHEQDPDLNQNEPLPNNGTSTAQSESSEPLKKTPSQTSVVDKKKPQKTCLQLAVELPVVLVKGWKIYMSQAVVFAGLSLAFLYMTVLGFDSVTIGYIYTNGIKEYYVGLSMGLAGVTGILGTFLFSKFNKKIGLQRTGLLAFSCEILCLTLTVASIWTPGFLFDPTFSNPKPNCTLTDSRNVSEGNYHRVRREAYDWTESSGIRKEQLWWPKFDSFHNELPGLSHAHLGNGRFISKRDVGENVTSDIGMDHSLDGAEQAVIQSLEGSAACEEPERATISIFLLLVGIVASRTGLWMADLVVTQLLQENVAERERGIVGGVQNSLNRLMDMIKFLLVILMPQVETFGILIILSFIFICLAGGLFAIHVRKFQPDVYRCAASSDAGHTPDVVMEIDVKCPVEV